MNTRIWLRSEFLISNVIMQKTIYVIDNVITDSKSERGKLGAFRKRSLLKFSLRDVQFYFRDSDFSLIKLNYFENCMQLKKITHMSI